MSDCILIPGNPKAYPKVRRDGKVMGAHRAVMLDTYGESARPFDAAHSCDQKRCVNPEHISPKTRSENVQEAYDRGLTPRIKGAIRQRAEQTHCIHHHEFTPENTYITPRGTRSCRRCHAESEQKRRGAERSSSS